MPIYEWRCEGCGHRVEHVHPIATGCTCGVQTCMSCGGALRRDYSGVSVQRATLFQPHFNHSVGAYVHNMQEFKDHLSRGSELQSQRTGLDHHYVPVEPGQGSGVTDSGLEETFKRRRDLGLDGQKVS